jgi:hypothetical protein
VPNSWRCAKRHSYLVNVPNVPDLSAVLEHSPVQVEHTPCHGTRLIARKLFAKGALPAGDEVIDALVRDSHSTIV